MHMGLGRSGGQGATATDVTLEPVSAADTEASYVPTTAIAAIAAPVATKAPRLRSKGIALWMFIVSSLLSSVGVRIGLQYGVRGTGK